MAAAKVWLAITRRKVFQPEQLETGNLRRCLTLWDLSALGVSATLGVGIYYLVGAVALDIAGPSVILSFFIAAVASLFAGLCYSEFGARVPRAGSAYIYTYVTVGELVAFIIGWNMILEALFGAASVARGLSLYVDLMVNKAMSQWFEQVAPLHLSLLATYFDFFAFGIVIAFGALLAFGVRESATVNNVFFILNMIVIVFIVFAGSFKADPNNWFIPESSVPPSFGTGGFFPFGVWGTLRGASICFYGFVGFDTINATSEEVENPRRTIPHAIMITLLVVFLCYATVAIVVTMMVPYYLHDSLASVATAFTYVGWDWARWVVLVGAIFGISASLYGSIFPLPRLLYAMASDGLLFHWFARISKDKKSPVIGTLVPSFIMALLAGLLELDALVMMMCVGTLLSYTIVAACIVILRYRSEKVATASNGIVKQLFRCRSQEATVSSSRLVNIVLSLYIAMSVIASVVTVHIANTMVWSIILHIIVLMLLIVVMMQPQAKEKVSFMTPLVPVIPCFSIYINICFMVLINVQTWMRVAIWVVLGVIVYFVCVCCYKRHEQGNDDTHAHKNGKSPVQIIIESPTPPSTIAGSSKKGGDSHSEQEMSEIRPASPVELKEKVVRNIIREEIIVQAAIIENNEEKEANIINLLDQVLQAEEDTYSMKGIDNYGEFAEPEDNIIVSTLPECIPHRKSLSELSDAGSDASLGIQVLSKYDVIAQVHREDLPKLNEEDDHDDQVQNEENEQEQVTAFNDSDSNSQTDESGYSDTIDRTALTESVEEIKEDIPNIPVPPPFDENFFKSPNFKKSYTISSRPTKPKLQVTDQEEETHRESIKSNSSQDDSTITFGSDRQVNFMSKLSQIYQSKIADHGDEEQIIKPGRRSHSTGNVIENTEYDMTTRERPLIFLDMKKELLARDPTSLRPVNKQEKEDEEPESEEETLSRADLKSKLENIFAAGGPRLLKPRLMKSNPPTPEESYQTDASSTESIPKLPKVDKNDTLGRQRAKFGQVLNSFRLSLNKDDVV